LIAEGLRFVVTFAVDQAVVELSEEAVVEVAKGGGMAVAVGSPAVVVCSCPDGVGQRGERPLIAGGGEPMVLNPAVHHEMALA
jgi:hypothetical protein